MRTTRSSSFDTFLRGLECVKRLPVMTQQPDCSVGSFVASARSSSSNAWLCGCGACKQQIGFA
jgi:hypothetical protein